MSCEAPQLDVLHRLVRLVATDKNMTKFSIRSELLGSRRFGPKVEKSNSNHFLVRFFHPLRFALIQNILNFDDVKILDFVRWTGRRIISFRIWCKMVNMLCTNFSEGLVFSVRRWNLPEKYYKIVCNWVTVRSAEPLTFHPCYNFNVATKFQCQSELKLSNRSVNRWKAEASWQCLKL